MGFTTVRAIIIRKMAANTQNQSEQGELGYDIDYGERKRGLQKYKEYVK